MSNILRLISAVFAVLFIGGQVSAMTLAEFKAAVLASPKYRYAYSTRTDVSNCGDLSGRYISSIWQTPVFRAVASTAVFGGNDYRHFVMPPAWDQYIPVFLDVNGVYKYGNQPGLETVTQNGILYGRYAFTNPYIPVYPNAAGQSPAFTPTAADRTSDRFFVGQRLVKGTDVGGMGFQFLDPEYADFEIDLYAYDRRGDRLDANGVAEFLMKGDDANGMEEYYLGRVDMRGVAMVMRKKSTAEVTVHFIPGTGTRGGDIDYTLTEIPLLSPKTAAEKRELERNGTWLVLSYSWLMETEYQSTYTLDDVKNDFLNAPCYWFCFKVTSDNNMIFADVDLRQTQIVPAKALGNVPVGTVKWARALERDVGRVDNYMFDILVNGNLFFNDVFSFFGNVNNVSGLPSSSPSSPLFTVITSGFAVNYSNDIGIKLCAVDVGRVLGVLAWGGGNWFGDVEYLKYRIVIHEKTDANLYKNTAVQLTFEPKYVRIDGSHAFTVYFKVKIPDKIRSQVFGTEWEKFLTDCVDADGGDPGGGDGDPNPPPPPPVDPGCCICNACCSCTCTCGKWGNCLPACSGNCKTDDPAGCNCHCGNPPPPPPPGACCDCGACCSCRCICGKWLQCGPQCSGACVTGDPAGCACHCKDVVDYTGCICGAGCEHCCTCRNPVTKVGWSVMKDGGGHICTGVCYNDCPSAALLHGPNKKRSHDKDGDGAHDTSYCCLCHCKDGGGGGDHEVTWPDAFDPTVTVNRPGLPPINAPLVQYPVWNIPVLRIQVPQRIQDRFIALGQQFEQVFPYNSLMDKFNLELGKDAETSRLPHFEFTIPQVNWHFEIDFENFRSYPWVPYVRKFLVFVIILIFIQAVIVVLRQY